MTKEEFVSFRKKLKKTQKQLAQLLGVSAKAIHSYEQGWRSIPSYVERQMIFLVTRNHRSRGAEKQCWVINNCPEERKNECPAWEFKSGDLCWFINGTICSGTVYKDWNEKIKICRACEALASKLR